MRADSLGSSNPVDVTFDKRTLSACVSPSRSRKETRKGTARKSAFACCLKAAVFTEKFVNVVANSFPVRLSLSVNH